MKPNKPERDQLQQGPIRQWVANQFEGMGSPFEASRRAKATRQALGLLGFADEDKPVPPDDKAHVEALRADHKKAKRVVRRFSLGIGAAMTMALATTALCLAPEKKPPFDPDAPGWSRELRTLLEASNAEISFLITPEAPGKFRFGFGPPTVPSDIAERAGDRITFNAFFSFPYEMRARYSLRWRDHYVQEYVGDFPTLREVLDTARCDVTATVRHRYSSQKTQIVRSLPQVPMRLVPDENTKHLIPQDFPLQICRPHVDAPADE